jgi:deoxycytidine triphosphate deaminase
MKHILGPDSRSTLTNVQEGDSQPNAVDLRVGQIFTIGSDDFMISDDLKLHRNGGEAVPLDEDGFYTLPIGDYEVVMENIVNVGEGEAGWVVTRSTLNRNGVFLTSGLYDSGYNGVMAAVLHVGCGTAKIQKGTRIGQYLSFDAESLSSYDGDYGINKKHDAKYKGEK